MSDPKIQKNKDQIGEYYEKGKHEGWIAGLYSWMEVIKLLEMWNTMIVN